MGLFKRIMADKQEQPVTTKQKIATRLSQRDPIEKLNLMEHSFNALTHAGVQIVGQLLKLVESGEIRTIHGLRSTSILEIEVKLAQLEIVDNSEVEAKTNTILDRNDVLRPREFSTETSSLTQPPPNQLHTDSQTVREIEQQVESDEPPTISESDTNIDITPDQNDVPLSQKDTTEEPSSPQHFPNPLIHIENQTVREGTQHVESVEIQAISEDEANVDATSDQNDISLSREDSIERLSLTRHTLNLLKHTDIRTVGDLLQWVESGRLQTIPDLGRISILEIEDELTRINPVDDTGVDANSGATPDQNDVPLSREDSIEKLKLTQYALNRLKQTDVRTVGELLQWVESDTTPALGQKSISKIKERLAQANILDDSETEVNTTPDKNDISLSRKDSTEEPSLTEHTDLRTVREDGQQVESSEPSTISVDEADTDAIPEQNDVPLSQEDTTTKKIRLTRDALNQLKHADVRTVGELLQWVKSGKPPATSPPGQESISEAKGRLVQAQTLDQSETEAKTNTAPDKNDVSLSREVSTEEQNLTQHTDLQTVREDEQQVESTEPVTISEVEANADAIPDQNDMYLSRAEAIEKLNLSRPSFSVLTRIGIRTVGEVLQLVESARPNMIRQAFGKKFTSEIRTKLAQVTILDDSETKAKTNITPDENEVSLSRKDSIEDPNLPKRSPNPLINADTQTIGEDEQQAESSEIQNIPEGEANIDAIPDQNDVPLSREDSIEKLNLTEYSFNALTALGVQTVGEVLELVESSEHRPISTLGRKFILEIEGKLAQVRILDDSEIEANKDAMLSKEEVSPSRKDPIEEPNLPQHSPNQLHSDIQTVGEVRQQVESTDPLTTSEGTANTNATPSQSDTYLSRGDTIEKLSLSQRSLNALRNADIWLVGELLQRVELGRLRSIRGLGQKSISEIETKMAQVRIHDNYTYLSKEDSIRQLNLRNRSFNAFARAGIQTVGEVLKLVESGKLQTIPALGRKSVLEIKIKLAQVKIHNDSEVGANIDVTPGRDYGYLSLEDPIDWLYLTPHSFNMLMRANIQTTGELLQLVESDGLKIIRGLGRKSILEIKEKLIQAKFLNDSEVEVSTEPVPRVVIRWQLELVNKQLLRGLLHEEAIIAEKPIKDWLARIGTTESNRVYEVLATILGSSLNICEEIEFFFNQIPGQNRMAVLLSTYGLETKNLRQTGDELGISRERVRQIRREIKDKATSIINLKTKPNLLRMQSALFIARDLGLDITYEQWTQRIQLSGLIGDWTSRNFVGMDAVKVMIAIYNLLGDCEIRWLQMPKNLQYAVQLAAEGKPNVPAKIPHAVDTLSDEVRRLINRHTKFSGGVYARWLSQEMEMGLEEVTDILQGLGYKALSKGWFTPHQISYSDVFHRCLRQMFQYCGQLSIEDICAGIRYGISRSGSSVPAYLADKGTDGSVFPVPPPDVMAEILRAASYQSADELYYWKGTYDEKLSKGETIIMNCLEQIGPVLHHSELVHAFIERELSLPALSATLNSSPLFDKVESGLYKLRGKEVTYQDIERAKAAGKPQSLRPEIGYDTEGNIIVSVTLSATAVGSGTILCERFPDLSGENWTCYVNGEEAGELNAVENEFRRMKKPFELLDCQSGDRVQFTFNTWERTVEIEKEEGNADS